MTSFSNISDTITARVAVIEEYIKANDLKSPSFDADSPSALPAVPMVQKARLDLIEAATALKNLAIGSADLTRWQVLEVSLRVLLCLQHGMQA